MARWVSFTASGNSRVVPEGYWKIENFRLPSIGWNMTLNRYIPLRRGDRNSVAQMFDACRKTLASGSSILMFPEGTRSRTGELQAFKTGAFDLALGAKVPVLPLPNANAASTSAESAATFPAVDTL